jgi:predicted MFS family arabinose efflux permease
MVDGHGAGPALSSGVYLAFNIAMAAGRFAGGRLLRRFTRPVSLCASALVGAVGPVLIIAVDNRAVAGAAALLWASARPSASRSPSRPPPTRVRTPPYGVRCDYRSPGYGHRPRRSRV